MNAQTAYLAGLIASDGHYNVGRDTLELTMNEECRSLFEEIAAFFDRPVWTLRRPGRNDEVRISFPHGPADWKEKVPEIDGFEWDYLRGLVDGDGCWSRGHFAYYHRIGEEHLGGFVYDLVVSTGFDLKGPTAIPKKTKVEYSNRRYGETALLHEMLYDGACFAHPRKKVPVRGGGDHRV